MRKKAVVTTKAADYFNYRNFINRKRSVNILLLIDTADPDNFLMALMVFMLYPYANIMAMITGRPTLFNAPPGTPKTLWDEESSIMAQKASAVRLKDFLEKSGINSERIKIYHGGIATRTPIPFNVHILDYAHNPHKPEVLESLLKSALRPQNELLAGLHEWAYKHGEDFIVFGGGPMTGLSQIIRRDPQLVDYITYISAMFGTFGEVELMNFGGEKRNEKANFNVLLDAAAAHDVLSGITCPFYMATTEVCKVWGKDGEPGLDFSNAEEFQRFIGDETDHAKEISNLYDWWWFYALRERKQPIFTYDGAAIAAAIPELRDALYEFSPVKTRVFYKATPEERDRWGEIEMTKVKKSNVIAATGLKPGGVEGYLAFIKSFFTK